MTEDIDAATAWFESTLGTTRCRTRYKSSLGGRVVVDGEPAEEWVIDVALVNAGPTNLEIIRPVSGAVELYRDGDPAGQCRRRSTTSASVSPTSTRRRRSSPPAAGRGSSTASSEDAIRFGYVDMTAELGHYVEVMELGPGLAAYFGQLEAESNR